MTERAWPLGGYAPGNYTCRCWTCGTDFEGDKRATTCLECAVLQAKAAIRAPAVPDGWPEEFADRLAVQLWRWCEIEIDKRQLIGPVRDALRLAATPTPPEEPKP